jgi:RNA polymerase sigma-70 factor (ECF subfamily)
MSMSYQRLSQGGSRSDRGTAIDAIAGRPRDDQDMPSQLRQFAVAFARRLSRGRLDHEDLAQAALERWVRHDSAAIPNPRAWIAVVVRRLLVDQLRRRRVEVSAGGDGPVIAAEPDRAPWWESVEINILRQELDRLRPDLRRTFELYSFEARSYKQIARELNIAIPTVGSRINRARRLLRRWLIARLATMEGCGAHAGASRHAMYRGALDCI